MENTKEPSEDGVEPRTGVEPQVGIEPQAGGSRHHEVDRGDETETRELLPSTSSIHSGGNGIRSCRASVSNTSTSSVVEVGEKYPRWMPFALRWYFIIFLAGYSITCAAVVFALYQYSNNHNGISTEDSAIPGWKFFPTLVAVVYTQLTAMFIGAVKRTEPFARMSKTSGCTPVGRYTLLEKTKPWWTTLVQGFQKRRNGGLWNWVMILSSSIYILAILGISPMSAALLGTKEIYQKSSEAVVQAKMHNGSTLHPQTVRNTYLRTMGAIFQNYSTSPWITDGFVILPFWPEDSINTGSRWDSQVSDSGTWEVDTTILHNDLVCTKLSMKRKDMYLRHAHNESEAELEDKLYVASVLLGSSHGCQFNFTVNMTRNIVESEVPFRQLAFNWVSWSDMEDIILGDSYSLDAIVRLNENCQETEIIMMSTPWWSPDPNTQHDRLLENMTMSGYACHSEYSMATIPARATSASGTLAVEFDQGLFQQMRTPVPSAVLDLLELRKIYTDIKWSQFVPQGFATGSDHTTFGGAAAMLGGAYNFSVPRMMADSDLPIAANRLRRRFFAEVVGDSLQSTDILEEHRTTGNRSAFVRKVLLSGQAASIICALLLISSLSLLVVLWIIQTKRSLNIYQDPSTILGISVWGSGNTTVLNKFTKLDLATRNMLKEELADRTFLSRHGSLDESEASFQVNQKKKTRLSFYDVASILPALKLRNLALLSLYTLGILAGIAVLADYARRSALHQAFFTYRTNFSLAGNAITISPFAIIPTLLAIIVALWWESVDTTCRTVQPYISMQHDAKRPSQGIALSYVSPFWLFASFKALQNRHWLLSLITATTFLLQVFTIAMSALFDSGNGFLTSLSEVPQTLELRNLPFVRQVSIGSEQPTWQFDYNITTYDAGTGFGGMVAGSLYTLDTDWMYTAIIQTALKGSQPEWSQDDWSFVPVPSVSDDHASSKENSSASGDNRPLTNMTVQTPAIRARLYCSAVDWSGNATLWLTAKEQSSSMNNFTGLDNYYMPEAVVWDGNSTTRFTAQADFTRCCANLTGNSKYNPSVIGYWTENWLWGSSPREYTSSEIGTGGNFTVKWVRGPTGFGRTMQFPIDMLYFPEPPAIQALNCMPAFESSRAEVTVEPGTGAVQHYRILDTPLREDVAWSDAFQWRNYSQDGRHNHSWIDEYGNQYGNDSGIRYDYDLNVTTSYGSFFMKSLLNAADIGLASLTHPSHLRRGRPEGDNLDDKVYNMRDNTTGLNLDFMSYAAYAQVGFNPTALLDPDILAKTSERVFATFFQHFVNNKLSQEHGGNVYQPRGMDLKINPPILNMPTQYTPDGSVAPKFEDIVRNTSATTTATITTRVEVLTMNPVAFWLATSILIWLIVTIIILASVQRRYYGGMMRNVECIADVLVLIAGSERLLAVIREKGMDATIKEDKIQTRIGWFRDPDGTMRWRIDLVEEKHLQRQPIRLGSGYTPLSDGNSEGGVTDPSGSMRS